MPKKRMRLWPSTKTMKVAGPTDAPTLSSQQPGPLWTLFLSIAELPLSNFIDCAVDGNYKALVRSGNPDLTTLLLHWFNISQQYNDAIGDGASKVKAQLYRNIAVLSITIEQVHMLCNLLCDLTKQSWIDELNLLLNTNFTFKDRAKDIERARNLTNDYQLKINIKKAQLAAMNKPNQVDAERPTRQYFESILITLSGKYEVTDRITTYNFCERIKRLTDEARRIKANERRSK